MCRHRPQRQWLVHSLHVILCIDHLLVVVQVMKNVLQLVIATLQQPRIQNLDPAVLFFGSNTRAVFESW